MFIEINDDEPDSFNACHMPALEENEARNCLILGLMAEPPSDPTFPVRRWTIVGEPGACAIQTARDRPVILGELNEAQCHMLAEFVGDCPGVVGPDESAQWFVERARRLGMAFKEAIPLRIHALSTAPVFPGCQGAARIATLADADLCFEWLVAFGNEAVPDDPKPARERLEKRLQDGAYVLWEVDGKTVAMAGGARRTRSTGAIAPVYTAPEFRGKGYGAAVTAAKAERIFAEGKATVCLFTDLRNPFSNRCYEKVGFKPVCDSTHYVRQAQR